MTQTVYTNKRIAIQLDDKPIAAGGEGSVYRALSTGIYSNSCVKIYHLHKRTLSKRKKIEFMINYKPQTLISNSYVICWPNEIIFDKSNNFIGFIMPLAFTGSESLYELTRTKTPKQLQQNWSKFDRSLQIGIEKRLKICVNIAIAVHSIHHAGKYAIVDYKPQNILITNNGRISITDVDSFQITNNGIVIFHSEVTTPEYSPPESSRINPSKSLIYESWDRFSLAVSFYEILFGIHPYAATCDGKYQAITTIGEKIQEGLFVHGSKRNYLTVIPSIHNNFSKLPNSLSRLFIKAFDEGHTNNNARPTAEEWGETIYSELKIKTGIKAYPISIPASIPSHSPSSVKTSSVSNISTTTYPSHNIQTKPKSTTKNKDTTFMVWFFIIVIVVISIILYNNKSTTKDITQQPTSVTISKVNQTGYISGNEFANIRSGPSTSYGIISKKYQGVPVYVIEKDLTKGWYKISYDKNGGTGIGYIWEGLISFNMPIAKSPQKSTEIQTIQDKPVQKEKTILSSKLNGIWIKNKGNLWGNNDIGMTVRYIDNMGIVTYVPSKAKNKNINQVVWKNFDENKNSIQVIYPPTPNDYIPDDIVFIDINTIKFSWTGDVFVRKNY